MCLARDRKPKLAKIRSVHQHLTNEEAIISLDEDEDPESALLKLMDQNYFKSIRYKIAFENTDQINNKEIKKTVTNEIEYDDEKDEEYNEERKTIKVTKKNEKKKKKGYVKSKLKLDDALKNSKDQKNWSPARIKAYQSIKKNPNAYYYRFNEPGEEQKNGPWSKEEKKTFFKNCKRIKYSRMCITTMGNIFKRNCRKSWVPML